MPPIANGPGSFSCLLACANAPGSRLERTARSSSLSASFFLKIWQSTTASAENTARLPLRSRSRSKRTSGSAFQPNSNAIKSRLVLLDLPALVAEDASSNRGTSVCERPFGSALSRSNACTWNKLQLSTAPANSKANAEALDGAEAWNPGSTTPETEGAMVGALRLRRGSWSGLLDVSKRTSSGCGSSGHNKSIFAGLTKMLLVVPFSSISSTVYLEVAESKARMMPMRAFKSCRCSPVSSTIPPVGYWGCVGAFAAPFAADFFGCSFGFS
mmetsp:Transcript_53824/g.117782  ORF Transcript_53824/g.117782 Transcript_53824/m.117782 type:complete len:271 (+) Transcript_53824:782-1594(+)